MVQKLYSAKILSSNLLPQLPVSNREENINTRAENQRLRIHYIHTKFDIDIPIPRAQECELSLDVPIQHRYKTCINTCNTKYRLSKPTPPETKLKISKLHSGLQDPHFKRLYFLLFNFLLWKNSVYLISGAQRAG